MAHKSIFQLVSSGVFWWMKVSMAYNRVRNIMLIYENYANLCAIAKRLKYDSIASTIYSSLFSRLVSIYKYTMCMSSYKILQEHINISFYKKLGEGPS